MDAQTLFHQGVTAIREDKDLAKGRDLLMQSLRLNPDNEIAWMWLSRTVSDKEKQRQCLERALKINPENEQAKALMGRLTQSGAPPPSTTTPTSQPSVPVHTSSQLADIKTWLGKAQLCLEQKDTEGAIEQWVRVLEVEPDHTEALENAVRHLSRLKYIDDARELVWNAINNGTQHPSVYLTAIDIARHQGNPTEADDLRMKLASLPTADETLVTTLADHFLERQQDIQALHVLQNAVEAHPKSQKLLLRLADLTHNMGKNQEALVLYEQAARLGTRTKEGKVADQKLLTFAPSLTDQERGSTLLAVREAFGFGVVALLMAWQDAGLDLARLGLSRWLGVLVSIVGGYLIVTATSSTQQQPLATWLGGVVPEPPEQPKNDFEAATLMPEHITQLPAITLPVRFLLGSLGLVLVALAVWLVFGTAIGLLTNPNPPDFYVPSCAEVFEGSGLC